MNTNKDNFTKEDLLNLDNETLVETIISLKTSLDETQKNYELVLEALKLRNQRSFGKKSESVDINQLSLDLGFNEVEVLADENIEEVKLAEAAPRKIKVKGKRKSDLSKITNHREEIIALSKEELDSYFGENNYKRLPDQIIQKLEHHPASFEAITYKVHVYVAKDDTKFDKPILRAKAPFDAFEKSIATPSLVSSIIHAKYVNAVPLYRQEKMYEDNNIFINRTNMANWVIKSYDNYLSHLYNRMKLELFKSNIIHADETSFKCSSDSKDRSKNYMWVYRSSNYLPVNKVVLYDYQKSRSGDNPKSFLKDYKGSYIVCDGYSVYHNLDNVEIAGCWVHAKRKYMEYIKSLGKDKSKGTLALEAVSKISNIFHQENNLKDLPNDKHHQLRQEIIKSLVDEYFLWIKSNINKVAPKSSTGEAFSYSLNQEKYLRTFLNDPSIPLENNAAEQSIRSFCVGRKNWVMIDSIKGAKASAGIYSIIETAKLNNLKLYDYINYLLEELPKYCTNNPDTEIPDNLLPWSKDLPDKLRKN